MTQITKGRKTVAVRMTNKEHWELKEKAARAKKTLSDFLVESASAIKIDSLVDTKKVL